MPTDHRTGSRRASGNRHPLLVGIVVGVLLGVGLSVGIAIWLKGIANPFLAQPKPVEPLTRPATRPPAAAPKADEAPARGDRPRFEFYDVLPGNNAVPERNLPPPREAPPARETAANEAPAKAAPSKDAVREGDAAGVKEPARAAPPEAPAASLWLQAGAFADPKDAENMRVQVALSGLEASVTVAEVPGRGRLHRVRVGPFAAVAEANRVKASLSQNGISTTLVRTEESR